MISLLVKNTPKLFYKLFLHKLFFIVISLLLPLIAQAYIVDGLVKLSNGDALPSVEIRVSNTEFATLMTNAQGAYSVDLPNVNKPYMITPRKTGYTFQPAYRYIENINQAHTVNFIASAVPVNPLDKKSIYYYINWGIYDRGYHVHEIPVEHLTHINYAFLMPFVVPGTLQIDDEVAFRVGQSGKIISVRHVDNHSVGLVLTDEFADIQKYGTGYLGSPGTYPNSISEWLSIEEKSRGVLGQLVQLKKAQALAGKDLKLVASVGGWTLSQHFPAIAENANYRVAFGQACKDFLDQTGFDGIDIDWEFPVVGGTDGTEQINGRLIPAQPHSENDPIYMLDLFKAIRNAIGVEYELSIACAQAHTRILSQYVWPGVMDEFNREDHIMDYLDYVNTMTYDYGGYWSPSSSHNAPLYKDSNDPAYNGSVSELIDILLDKDGGNMSPDQLVMGLGYYGRAMEGIAAGPNGDGLYQTNPYVGAVYGSWDTNIPDREAAASLDFADLKFGKALNKHHYINKPDSGFIEYWNDIVKLPYLYNPDLNGGYFVSYDDENSLAEKVRFANSRNLGGIMVWEVTQDSKEGYLTQIIHDELTSAKINISGKIVGRTGLDLSQITVTLSASNFESLVMTTLADGVFSFSDLTPGKDYYLIFEKTGYTFDFPSYDLSSLHVYSDIEIHASDHAYSISGMTNNNENPLAGSDIQLSIGSTQVIQQVSSSEDGSYQFMNVPGGFDYVLTATNDGYNNLTGPISLTNFNSDRTGLNFDFELLQFSISGTITNDQLEPISGVQVIVSGDIQATYTTDSAGHYATALLDARGTYIIQAMDGDKVFEPTEKVFTGLTQNESLDFIYNETPTVSGFIKNGADPIPNTSIVFSSQVTNWFWVVTQTDANGYYEFRNVPLGIQDTYLLVEQWQGDFFPANRVDLGALTGSTQQNFNTQENYIEGYELNGYVKEGGMGIENATVSVLNVDSNIVTIVTTDVNGRYSFTLAKNGHYQVSVEKLYYTFSPASYEIMDLAENTTVSDFIGEYSRAIISGRVVFGETSLTGVSVVLSGEDVALSMEVDSEGFFEFIDLEKNKDYTLTFSKEFFNIADASINSLSENINLGDIEASFNGSLYSITGIITDQDNNPVQDVQVSLTGFSTMNMSTDSNGAFSFSNLIEGESYSIALFKNSLVFTPSRIDFASLSQDEIVISSAKEITFTPLPDKVIVGYWHNWGSSSAPFMKLSEVVNTNYNVCDVSFIETWKLGESGVPEEMTKAEEGAYPKFSVFTNYGQYSDAEFKADVKVLQAAGIPVLISIGGQNGHVELNTEAEKDIYVQGVIDIVTEYGFDGIDIDYEGGSMTVLNGPSNSLEYSAITDPELKYGVDAIREIKAHFGQEFLITTAPELYYVQEGRSSYPSGSQFIAFLHNIRDILDLIHVQYYNFGGALWSSLDGQKYSVGDVDLVVAMTDMLIQGFPLTNGLTFPGLRQDQVAIGLPCVPNAAGGVTAENPKGYYFTPTEIIHALNYLMKGEKDASLDYTLVGEHYPNLRGIMTWSINWDATTDGSTAVYEFANAYSTYFALLASTMTLAGTPHNWLDGHGLVDNGDYEAAEMKDSDGDGYNNHQEYIMGTSPIDGSSVFKLDIVPEINAYTLNWPVIENRRYQLQWTDSLSKEFQTIETLSHPSSSYTDTEHQNMPDNFYRIKVDLVD